MPESRAGTWRPLCLVAGCVVLLDQVTKAIVRATIELHDAIPVAEGWLNLVHVRNPGAAFSLLADVPAWFREPFFVTITVAAVAVLLVLARRLDPGDRITPLAMGGVLGGAVGNLIDRLVFGEVIDFVDVYWGRYHWPAFNVADSSISVAVATVLIHSLLVRTPSGGSQGESRAGG